MLNDIFATTMTGSFRTHQGESIIQLGTWSYRGFGTAEIMMTCEGEIPEDGERFSVQIHSSDYQLDSVLVETWRQGDEERKTTLRADISGYQMDIAFTDADGTEHAGSLTVPEETIYMGPSPIWLIHNLICYPVPGDREITTPYISFSLGGRDLGGGFFRFSRAGLLVTIEQLDAEGNVVLPGDAGDQVSRILVSVAEDGCPRTIRNGHRETEILRTPNL